MSSRTLSKLLWHFLALSVQVHDKCSHLSCLTPGGRPHWMLWSLMEGCAPLVSTESSTAAQEWWDWVKYISTEGFSPWENQYLHCHAEKIPNNAGNGGRGASSVSSFCITSHSDVWIHDSVDKARLPHTFSIHSSLYNSFTTTDRHCEYHTLFNVLLL